MSETPRDPNPPQQPPRDERGHDDWLPDDEQPTSTMTVAIAMPLITLYKRSGGFWNIQKISEYPPLETSPICSTTAK